MLELHEITIEKKDLLDRYLKICCNENSELTFTNLFMWRHSYNMKYAIINDLLVIIAAHGNSPHLVSFPVGDMSREEDVRGAVSELLNHFDETKQTVMLRVHNDSIAEFLEKLFPGQFIITEDINMFDYVYSVPELISLSGKKFHQKRNHINKFKSLYEWEYRKITAENLSDCVELFERWYSSFDSKEIDVSEGKEAFDEFIANFEKLDIPGGGIYVDGKLIAFSFGEPLCAHTVVVHFEVADTEYQGAFPMMNQQFLENEWSEYDFVNREEDMGLEGLRHAKRSYNPVTMTKKYVATVR